MCVLIQSIHIKYKLAVKGYMGEGTMKMDFSRLQLRWWWVTIIFWKVSVHWKHSRYADISTNSFRILPSVSKYDLCRYLYTVEIANQCPRCFLLCTVIFVIAMFNPFYRDCTIGHGVEVQLVALCHKYQFPCHNVITDPTHSWAALHTAVQCKYTQLYLESARWRSVSAWLWHLTSWIVVM